MAKGKAAKGKDARDRAKGKDAEGEVNEGKEAVVVMAVAELVAAAGGGRWLWR